MEDEGTKAQVKEGGSVLKRSREEDPIPNSAAETADTKAEVEGPPISKRPSMDPNPLADLLAKPAGIKVGVVGGMDFSGWTCYTCSQEPLIGPLPEMEEEEETIDESDCIYQMEGGRLVLVGFAPKPPPITPGEWDPEEDDPFGVSEEMIARRKAELKGAHLTLNDPLFTTRISAVGHPYPFLVGDPSIGAWFNLDGAQMAAARAAAADSDLLAVAAASSGNN